jgi:two-component system, NtrC family, response regulator AtoC
MQTKTYGPKVLVAEDEQEVRDYLQMALKCLGYSVEIAQDGEEVMTHLASGQADFSAVLLDLVMPRRDGMEVLKEIRHIAPHLPVVIVSGAASTLNVVTAMKCGAADFLCKPVGHDELLHALNKLVDGQGLSGPALPPPPSPNTKVFLGTSPKMQEIQALIQHIGWSEASVLIQGETGTGKEVLARELHAHSPRAGNVFLKLNCAALPSELVESELFGYERGAFTGAFQKKIGMFEAADGGTILLDEIGDMDIRLQAKLLQVLQDQEFQRIGGRETIKVDVRVMAATHRDLEMAIEDGKFREDLYYRLNVINLELPPLRERHEDILPLADYLLKRHSGTGKGIAITGELRDTLRRYPWPGNVRELENVIRRLIVLRNPKHITRELNAKGTRKTLPTAGVSAAVTLQSGAEVPPILEQVTKAKERAETEAILAALNSTRWNRKQAAALLKIDYKALLYKMKKLGVDDEVISFPPSSDESVQVITANTA